MIYEDHIADIDHHDTSGSLTDPTSSGSDLDESEDDISAEEEDVPWSESVGKTGDVFYVEPSRGPISSIAIEEQSVAVTTAMQQLNKNDRNSTTKSWTGNLKKQFRKSITERLKNGIGGGPKIDEVLSGIHGVTFQDKSGILKEVRLFVDPEKNNFGRRSTAMESLFGIVPGTFAGNDDRRIMVQGLTPRGEAMRSREVKIGDWLMKIDGQEVNADNAAATLGAIRSARDVRITLQRFAQEAYITSPIARRDRDTENLVRFMNGLEMPEIHNILNTVPHVAMYLTLDSESDSEIAYKYPKKDSDVASLCGLYISLGHMLKEATDSDARNSTIVCNGRPLHVGHRVFGREVLVIAAPADKVPATLLSSVVEQTTRLLTFLFGSVSDAFKSPIVDDEAPSRVDHLFSLLFQRLLLPDELSKRGIPFRVPLRNLLDVEDGVRWLNLPDAARVDVNNVLSDLEAADFGDMSDDFYGIRRRYSIVGSCLYHKGFLIASHLPAPDLADINLYVRYYCLLALSRHRFLSQLIVWKEVFPSSSKNGALVPGYEETPGRHFLLVVGMKYSLLCVSLRTGGCAEPALGNPPPDPFYVDQAKATLVHLQSVDLAGLCDKKLREPPTPQLANPENFFPNTKIARGDSSTALDKIAIPSSPTKKNPPESILKKRGSPNSSQRRASVSGSSVGERESDADSLQSVGSNSNVAAPPVPLVRGMSQRSSAGSNESVASGASGTLFRNQKQTRNLPSIYDLNGTRTSHDEHVPELKLTSGLENVLFHYVNVERTDGLILCPLNVDSNFQPSYKRLVENFAACCQRIKTRFPSGNDDGDPSRDGRPLGDVYEEGVLFECEPERWSDAKRSPPTMCYWVVGRMIRDAVDRREVYLCFHESIPQHIVELIFQLKFGTGL
ncbi:protein inturned-like [Tubulanus polymorphus]|uniref:protein inturned-like n=1 Tax=Tubulanus polymorphus TaxID=672921 RepID=UPI003DA3F23F